MADKIIWVLTVDRNAKTTKVVRSKKEVGAEYERLLVSGNTKIISVDANTYISYDCKALHALAKLVF